MKVVINRCYGGFGLSDEAIELYGKLKGFNLVKKQNDHPYTEYYLDGIEDDDHYFSHHNLYPKEMRTDKELVAVVELLGEKANGEYAELKVVEIPDYIEWLLEEYDGIEWIAEKHRTWS